MFRYKILPGLLLVAVAAFGQKPPDKASAYYHYSLGHLYAELARAYSNRADHFNKAIEQYQKITALEPKDTDGWLMLGRLQKIAQNSAEAMKAYKKALELDPDNDDAMTGLAMVYADVGETKQATELLRRAAEKNPNPRSLTTLASAYEQMHDYALAVETLRRALDPH